MAVYQAAREQRLHQGILMKHWIHGLTCLLLLSQLPLQAVEIGSAEAMRLALQDEPTRDRLESCPALDARVLPGSVELLDGGMVL